MIAPTERPVKIKRDHLRIWMQAKGFQEIRGQWVAQKRCAMVTPLLNGFVLVQVGVPA